MLPSKKFEKKPPPQKCPQQKCSQIREDKKKVEMKQKPSNGQARPQYTPEQQENYKKKLLNAGVTSEECLKCGEKGHSWRDKHCMLSQAAFNKTKCSSCKKGLHTAQNCLRTPFMQQKPQKLFTEPTLSTKKGDSVSKIIYC